MDYKQVQNIEEYLRSKKTKTPDDISFARNHLLLIKDELGEEQLSNIKIYYQSQLVNSPFAANYLAIIAILVSVIVFMLSTLSPSSKADMIVVGIISLIVIILMLYIKTSTDKIAKKNVTYTIIINLIDELLGK